jgi:transposase
LLADLGVIPELTTLFGPVGRRWLAELPMAASARGRLEAGLRLIDAITVEVKHADVDLRTQFAGDHRVRRLLPIPGIGLVTATTVVAEVWDIQRFPSPARLCSWAGLTPGERTSDAQTRRGHITKQGSRWLRWILVEAATSAVRDPQLGRFAGQIAQRRGPKIARVALARRLLTLC